MIWNIIMNTLIVIIPIVTDIISIFLSYAIIMKSPPKMKFIRLFLLKLTICWTVMVHGGLWGIWPDSYQPQFPLTLVKINNPLFHWDMLRISFVTVFTGLCLAISSIAEGCAMRFAITYKIQILMKLGNGKLFVIFHIAEVVAVIIFGSIICLSLSDSGAGLEQFIIKHSATYLLNDFDLKNDKFIFLSPDNPYYWPAFILALFLFSGFGFILCAMTYFTHRKIMKAAEQMSVENYTLQKRLTIMMLIQILLPIVMGGIPIGVLALALIIVFALSDATSAYRLIYGQLPWAYPVLLLFPILFPLFNTIFTIIVMKPYRIAILELFGIGCRPCGSAKAALPSRSRNRKLHQHVQTVILADTINNSIND